MCGARRGFFLFVSLSPHLLSHSHSHRTKCSLSVMRPHQTSRRSGVVKDPPKKRRSHKKKTPTAAAAAARSRSAVIEILSDEEDADDYQSDAEEGREELFEVKEIVRRRIIPTKGQSKKKKTSPRADANQPHEKEDPKKPPEAYEYLVWWQNYPRDERSDRQHSPTHSHTHCDPTHTLI